MVAVGYGGMVAMRRFRAGESFGEELARKLHDDFVLNYIYYIYII